MKPYIRLAIPGFYLFTAPVGCIVELDEEEFPPGEFRPLCVYPEHPAVLTHGGTFSLRFNEGNYWIFGETILTEPNSQGQQFLSNIGAISTNAPLSCTDELEFIADGERGKRWLLTRRILMVRELPFGPLPDLSMRMLEQCIF